MRKTLLERFEEKFIPEPNSGCWLWTASLKPNGYGQFGTEKSTVSFAHRISYELYVGPIPEGLTIDHKCRVRCCVNPGHLEPVTKRVNTLRGVGATAINAKKTHCVRGHEFTSDNTFLDTRGQRICRSCYDEKQYTKKINRAIERWWRKCP